MVLKYRDDRQLENSYPQMGLSVRFAQKAGPTLQAKLTPVRVAGPTPRWTGNDGWRTCSVTFKKARQYMVREDVTDIRMLSSSAVLGELAG